MQIGVIGSGKVGKALGAWFAKSGVSVLFTSRDESHARDAAEAAGHGAKSAPIAELVASSRVILLTLPFAEISKVLHPLRVSLAGKTVVDVTNPITPDRQALVVGLTDSGAETVAREFPKANVVKAFNAVFAEVYQSQNPQVDGRKVSILYAGDDKNAKSDVRDLIGRLGFDPVDAGPLRNARCLEPLSLLNIQLGRFLGYGTGIAFSLLQAGPKELKPAP
jgi:8-hydroxy-5-deazaflavin:NADPH oxidoreductase